MFTTGEFKYSLFLLKANIQPLQVFSQKSGKFSQELKQQDFESWKKPTFSGKRDRKKGKVMTRTYNPHTFINLDLLSGGVDH